MMEQLMIRDIISQVTEGSLRIPSFQRGFVWEPENVAFFIDSLYKQYPIGAVLIWRTRERLQVERNLGNFELPEPKEEYPINYILDGQQRITSIFSVFQTQLEPQTNSSWMNIYYIIGSKKTPDATCFIALDDADVDPKKHFPLNVLFDPVKYRKAVGQFDEATAIEIDELFGAFQGIAIPVQIISTDDKASVAIVFERINRAGVPLNSFQLLTAWSWSTEFDLQEKLDELSSELSGYGFDGLAEDQNLIMKCFTGYILGDTSPAAIMQLNGAILRDSFQEISAGIKSSIDFIKKELNIHSLDFLPYPAMLVSLTKFFGTNKANGGMYNEKQRKQLIRWFWHSCFSRRYSSGVNAAHAVDLQGMERLKKDENADIVSFKCDIPKDFFINNNFSITSVNTKTFIALLASMHPKSFISGANVDSSKTLQKASSKEFHHIFPEKFLQKSGIERKDIYSLANFCFLNNADNQKIKDKSPKVYQTLISDEVKESVLKKACCPLNTFDLDYFEFRSQRNDMLIKYALTLI